jgi:hypothetical protein
MVRPPQMEQQLNVRQCTLVCEGVLALAISNVCYSRGLFEPDDFDDVKLFQGQPVQHKLKDNERTAELWRWLREGVNPALEKRYLDKVLFIISADKAGENGARAARSGRRRRPPRRRAYRVRPHHHCQSAAALARTHAPRGAAGMRRLTGAKPMSLRGALPPTRAR